MIRDWRDVSVRLIVTFIFTLLASIPIDLFLITRYITKPAGFLENIVLIGLGFWVLGGLQFLFFIVWCIMMYLTWLEK